MKELSRLNRKLEVVLIDLLEELTNKNTKIHTSALAHTEREGENQIKREGERGKREGEGERERQIDGRRQLEKYERYNI